MIQNFRRIVLARASISEALIGQLGWTTASYGAVQIIRFAQNIVLTHILAPELFGIMIVLTSLRVGIELFTDIGVSQNLVASKDGWKPEFYNTAWTLQIIRGVLIALVFAVLLPVIRNFYHDEQLDAVFPVLIVLFLLTGTHSVAPFLASKAMDTKAIAKYEISSAIVGAIAMIAITIAFPTIWGLVAANVVSTLISSVFSYFCRSDLSYKLQLDVKYVWEMVSFGKWIFLSSIIYFLAGNFDRLILGNYITLALLGVYGIARSLGDIFGQFALRLGNTIIFPLVASSNLDRPALREKLARRRMQFLGPALCAMALFIALGDTFVRLIYDSRYAMAGVALPWIGLAMWASILNTLTDNVMLGIRKPANGAIGNVAKFVTLLMMLPWAAMNFGIAGAAMTTVAAEVVRYALLAVAQVRERMYFVRQDILTTALLLLVAFGVRAAAYAIGIAPSPDALFILNV